MKQKFIIKLSALIAGISGLVILAGVVIPIAGYESFANQKYPILLNPMVQDFSGTTKIADDTKASNWFPNGNLVNFSKSDVSYFTISIPRLKIENASVAIAGEDLKKSLIQYPGTALPGKLGNTVVFGHSVLPLFFSPKNYMSIFSTLPTLKTGDEILVDYDGVSFKYQVESLTEILPTDLSVLDQKADDSYITLVTCTPPGDPRMPKRLAVKARVLPFGEASSGIYNKLQ